MITGSLSRISMVSLRIFGVFSLVLTLSFFTVPQRSLADPVPTIIPVFCFRITDIEAVPGDAEGDSFKFEFEVLNWTDKVATTVYIASNVGTGRGLPPMPIERPIFTNAGIDSDGRPITLRDVNNDGFINNLDLEDANGNGILDPGEDINNNGRLDNDPMPGNAATPNDWSATLKSSTAISWTAGSPVFPIDLIDINPQPPLPNDERIGFMEFTDPNDPQSVVPETIDDGDN